MTSAPAEAEGRPSWREAFSSFGIPNYRLYFSSLLLVSTGTWTARVAIDWVVLEITGNVALVGLTIALQFAPAILLGAWSGVLADRYQRRRILTVTTSLNTVVVAMLATLVLIGVVHVGHVFAAALIVGVTSVVDLPARSALLSDVVGVGRLGQAVSLNATTFHLGGLLGPAISGGLIMLFGSGWSIAASAVISGAATILVALIRSSHLEPAPKQPRSSGQIREAVRYAAATPAIFWPIVLLVFVSSFGMSLPVLLAAAASPEGYDTGAAGYGLYSTLAAAGALVGALLSARRRSLRLRTIVSAVLVYGAVTAFCGVAPALMVFMAALFGVGATRITFATAAQSMAQLAATPGNRGRILSLYFLVLTGGQAVSGLIIGAVAESLGVSVGFLVAGGVPFVAGAVVGIILVRRRQLRVLVNLRTPRQFVRIVHRDEIIAES